MRSKKKLSKELARMSGANLRNVWFVRFSCFFLLVLLKYEKKVLKFLQHFGKFIKSLVIFLLRYLALLELFVRWWRKLIDTFYSVCFWTLRLLFNSLVYFWFLFLSFEKETQNSFNFWENPYSNSHIHTHHHEKKEEKRNDD